MVHVNIDMASSSYVVKLSSGQLVKWSCGCDCGQLVMWLWPSCYVVVAMVMRFWSSGCGQVVVVMVKWYCGCGHVAVVKLSWYCGCGQVVN